MTLPKPDGHWQIRTAEDTDAGQRVDRWLSGWTELSRARVKALIEAGQVRANGDIVGKVTGKIVPETEYAVFVPPPVDDTPTPEDIPLSILFEDDQLIVLDKPSGLTVHPAPGSRAGTLVNALLHHCADSLSGIGGVMRPGIVHRLDKDTSGVMIVAKTDVAHRGLAKQFARHSIERAYVCLVRGRPHLRTGTVTTRLARSVHDRKKQAVVRGTDDDLDASDHGRHAVTHYETLRGFGQKRGGSVGTPVVSELECRLETGRTHQIRVHMAHIGCPLLGDPLYGNQKAFMSDRSPEEMRVRDAVAAFKRQALHARLLGFVHPVTKEAMRFETPPPDDYRALVGVLSGLPRS
ncbi:RluA family pseudouridine synthase [uncultured Algimonas sp.]|uniref:RluA family pseudouridine synthase n=1 Tax=uncultured Algimonas sp. TaxID=1547920 RepID=UPI002635F1F7|nr:RluA family pseudouridine synthase [uncultured Algimonas sp.]